MGILNLTPDSFSGDGLFKSRDPSHDVGATDSKSQIQRIVEIARKMADEGADIIDIGGESSRPKATPVSKEEELNRVIPVIKSLAGKINVPISIDTHKHEVAEEALDNGASIVNDISALADRQMPKVIRKYKAAVVLMHMKDKPYNMQNNPQYEFLIPEIIGYLDRAIKVAIDSGIESDRIIIDPGIGFGKTLRHNLEIIKRLSEFKKSGYPVLVGPSRKSFIGNILDKNPDERIFGTAAAVALIITAGVHIVRVHDVKEMRDVAKVTDAIMQCS